MKKRKFSRTIARQKNRPSSGPQGGKLPQHLLQEALAHHQAGRLAEAEVLYRQILETEPAHPEALHFLGMIAHQVGKSELAAELIRRALGYRPDYFEAHSNLGVVLTDQGKLDEAVVSYRRALSLKPDNAEMLSNLGNTLKDQGKLDEAEINCRQALALQPENVELGYNFGNILIAEGKLNEAIATYLRVLTQQPDYAKAHNNLGYAYNEQGKFDAAEASYRRALALQPDYAEAHYNLGIVLNEQGRLDEAEASYRRALALQPDYAEAHYNLGTVFDKQGKLTEAIACFRRALALQPDYPWAFSNLLLSLNYLPEISQQEIYDQSRQYDKQVAVLPSEPNFVPANEKEVGRRLKIGYVSSDFRHHSVAYFVAPLLRAHNRGEVEIYCYANVKKPDERTSQLQAMADHWCSIIGMSDHEAAERIHRDRIDILVDLGGYTGNNRLPVFARKPAPVQVTWLGYPNTTGLRSMDYRFTDAIADPPGEADRLHTEKLVRLKHGFLCYQPDDSAPEPEPPPCLEQGYITFGSFNNLHKVTPEVIKAWAAILHQEPRSRLVLKAKLVADAGHRQRFLQLFAENGIAAERLTLHDWLPGPHDHLQLYNLIDIGLDPFPYNGTTTTCEALWMGVPVVTLSGERHAARVGASILHRVGQEELVTPTAEAYREKALALARDRQRLQTLRRELRQRLRDSPLLNAPLFAATVEDAYRRMWRQWCET